MHRSIVAPRVVARRAVLGVVLFLAAGCAWSPAGSQLPSGGAPAASAQAGSPAGSAAGSGTAAPPLPRGFPVLPGASLLPRPDDDPGLIAAWTSDHPGSAAYDFYVAALPAAGYPLEGLYPGGEWAMIRFRAAEGRIWQVVMHSTAARTVEIEVRLDRP